MKLNKKEGIEFLKAFNIPTVQTINIDELIMQQGPLKRGISVRTSIQYYNKGENVYLPSIHNCKNPEEIKKFINTYRGKYNIFAHETVQPEIIGSVSKLDFRNCVVLETYLNFVERKEEKIHNRMIIPLYGDKMQISKLEMLKEDPKEYKDFKKVIYLLNDIPFSTYDMEYVIQNGEVIFTDLTLPNDREYTYLKSYIEEQEK